MSWANDTVDFMADPFGLGNSLLGGISKSLGLDNNSVIDRAQGTLDEVLGYSNDVSRTNKNLYQNYLDKMQGTYGTGAQNYDATVQRLADAIGDGSDLTGFNYRGNVNDFYDKFANQRAQQAMDAISSNASSGGSRFSSSYNDAVAAKQQALASEEWSKAYDKMMQDRSQQLAEWNAGQSQKQNYLYNLGTLTGLYGNDRNQLTDALGNYYSNMANQNNSDLQVYSDITANKANLDAQRKSGIGSALGAIGSVIGAIF